MGCALLVESVSWRFFRIVISGGKGLTCILDGGATFCMLGPLMLLNPFTPSEIAASPELFFGRRVELETAEAAIKKGSLLIQGGIGIGKSSLLAQVRSRAEGFGTANTGDSVCVVGHKDVKSVDDLARLLLDSFVEIDESSNSFKLKFGGIAEYESREVVKNFTQGRHLSTLLRILTKEHLAHIEDKERLLVIAIDEGDKCPIAIARLIRALSTHLQQEHIARVRFVVAGVNPYFKVMLDEDEGLQRFFYEKIHLQPMPIPEAQELFEQKLKIVVRDAEEREIGITVNPDVVGLSVALSGGHPHVLQLLGSHIIDHENSSGDGEPIIDKDDMMEALRVICYEDRGYVYDRLLHALQASGHLIVLKLLLSLADRSFPTRIPRDSAGGQPMEALEWLTDNNVLLVVDEYEYGLVDEFLRIRMLLDFAGENPRDMSSKILSSGSLQHYPMIGAKDREDADYYEEIARDFAKQHYRKLRPKDPFED